MDRILKPPEFMAAIERRKARYTEKQYELMRSGTGVELIRYLGSAANHRGTVLAVFRPLIALAVKVKRLLLREKHWL